MLESLRAEVYEANMEVVRRGLVLYTFGNASGISRDENLVAIKPSGVPYETLRPEHLVISDLDGRRRIPRSASLITTALLRCSNAWRGSACRC